MASEARITIGVGTGPKNFLLDLCCVYIYITPIDFIQCLESTYGAASYGRKHKDTYAHAAAGRKVRACVRQEAVVSPHEPTFITRRRARG